MTARQRENVGFREAYRQIELYEPGRIPVDIDLSDNTNLFGVAPSVRSFFDDVPDLLITRYPSVFAKSLKEALAELHGVAPQNIATGCGSDDLIDSAVRAFCEPGERVVYPAPTFGVVSTFARMNATEPVAVMMRDDFSVDTQALIDARATVTYVCSPNNPTGTLVAREEIGALDTGLSGLLILDEAYADFGDVDYASFAATSNRTVSLRTFSKAGGLAGLRVGYMVGPTELILEIEKSRGPYKVGGVAEAAAMRVVSADREWVAGVVTQTRQNRARLSKELEALGVRFVPSRANFILIRLPAAATASGINAALRERGISARPFPALPHVGECLRVTIGPWDMMQRFLDAFSKLI